jgi:hypothetical protein
MSTETERVLLVRMSNAQVGLSRDVAIMETDTPSNAIVLKGRFADTVKAAYRDFTECPADNRTLKITLEIEIPLPKGELTDVPKMLTRPDKS